MSSPPSPKKRRLDEILASGSGVYCPLSPSPNKRRPNEISAPASGEFSPPSPFTSDDDEEEEEEEPTPKDSALPPKKRETDRLINLWDIKKKLKLIDVSSTCRLSIPEKLIHDNILPLFDDEEREKLEDKEDVYVKVWDIDTDSEHNLVLRKSSYHHTYVFVGDWKSAFVIRRNLKVGDEIGMLWDCEQSRFIFGIIKRSP